MSITAQQFDELHSGYGEDISVSDADGRVYHQETCQCGMPLGMHLSLEAHRAQELERYVQERIIETAGNNHTEILTRVVAQIADLEREMRDFDSVPMHIHAILDQIGTETAIDAGLPDPRRVTSDTDR
ncbi:hypothetical protein Achl_4280 (plasmid) [Pseudarthrobacter chlorophenolicus A6]|uniref:Uncharacterized protein n=1 Tax=Pseudarthrobacter chlorophenolicus (strain ATCC 700700 / DSM 12829 / CIP 107037 / JCM 12360 / KCTC 9906 / NCIMB 13794 / A6) TaxID=452863 RepID=B8HII4_PSECP|nr:hypothetical protein [Pseudarthrobacter chlorophenolicus]ACL42231.1 hypothetical protein Achl_4280 [Pseudarthrobacter chlorophenolicus A6]SDQ15216.1 hypothetical protein SAMN04489738_0338 [Pseudarthrobacter chlorophenolicus]